MKPLVVYLGATDVTMPYILDYAPYVIWGLSAFAFSSFLQAFVRNDGAPKLSMIAVITGGVLNIILDIVFVFPLDMGMAGASIASVIGAGCTVLILLGHFFTKSCRLRFSLNGFAISRVVQVFANGFTSFVVEIASGITLFVFNIQLLKYAGDTGVTMYGVICNTAIIITCLANGINQAAQPIISTNHGAGLNERVAKVRKLAMKTALIVCSAPAIICMLAPNVLTNIFLEPNEAILAMSASAIRIYFISFLVMGVNMFVVGYFQATAKPYLSLIVCLARGCIFSVLFVTILAPLFEIIGIWLSIPLAEFATLLIALYLIKKNTKEAHA